MWGTARAKDVRDLVFAEVEQYRESGYNVAAIDEELSRSGGFERISMAACEEAYRKLDHITRDESWTANEPESLEEIRASARWPEASSPDLRAAPDYEARLRDAWTGRVCGNMLGKPVEAGDDWTSDRLVRFLKEVGNWPVQGYFPDVDPTTMGYPEFRECRSTTVAGKVDGSSRDDDVDYTVLNLHLLLDRGRDFQTSDVAAAWLTLLPVMQTYTAERATICRLIEGYGVPEARLTRNPYREWIGAAIRADVFGYVNPGDCGSAAELAYKDAVVSHAANGVYGEMWCAALVAAAFDSSSAREAIERALAVIPPRSRLYREIVAVMADYDAGMGWSATVKEIQARTGHYSWVHTINNAGILTAGLLYGAGSFTETIGLTVAGGWDTDSNGATAGSVGALLGYSIPETFSKPLHGTVHSAVFGWDGVSIDQLAALTARVDELSCVESILGKPLLRFVTPEEW